MNVLATVILEALAWPSTHTARVLAMEPSTQITLKMAGMAVVIDRGSQSEQGRAGGAAELFTSTSAGEGVQLKKEGSLGNAIIGARCSLTFFLYFQGHLGGKTTEN